AATVTVTYERYRSIKRAIIDWTSDTDGTAEADVVIDGEILKIQTDPDGTSAPTDNYDIVLNDEEGLDAALGYLNNRSNATSQAVVPVHKEEIHADAQSAVHRNVVSGALTFSLSNAGSATKGRCVIYYR